MYVAPSFLSFDFANFTSQMEMLNRSEATYFHIDIMDGNFVPNISIGFPAIKSIASLATKPLDVHMMVNEPGRFIPILRDCDAWLVNVHYESCRHLSHTIDEIHSAGMKAGVTINPATPVAMLEDVIDSVELVLIMSVNPGFGGQSFIPNSVKKVAQLRNMIERHRSKALIEVDGGVNEATGALLAEAGADILVAGNYIFNAPDPEEAIRKLRRL